MWWPITTPPRTKLKSPIRGIFEVAPTIYFRQHQDMQPGRATRSRKRRRGNAEHKRAPTKLPTNDLQASAHGCQAVKVCDVKVLPALQRLVSRLADRCLHGRACLWLQLDNRKPIDLWRQTRSLRR